jgi:hypothetical protein
MRMPSTAGSPRSPGSRAWPPAGTVSEPAGTASEPAGTASEPAGVVPSARPALALARQLPGPARRGLALARANWLLAILLTAGLVLRVLTQLAYQPALLYIDSTKYLLGAYPGDDPPGYRLALAPLLAVGNLALVAAVQHLLGLAMAVALYALLRRRGARRWLSALATAPVLLDGYQLQIEQLIMPNLMFEALIVAGLTALAWQPRPRPGLAAAAGLALGASATVFQPGEILILPALFYLLLTPVSWRHRWQQAGALCLAFALPILFASYKNYLSLHRFALAPYSSGTIYGRMAQAADCATLRLPADERFLCPTPAQKRLGPNGLDHSAGSPIKGLHDSALVRDFWHRVLLQQPLNVAAAVARDAAKLFALTRDGDPGDPPISAWQFQRSYPTFPPYVTLAHGSIVFGTYTPQGVAKTIGTGAQFGAAHPVVIRPLAAFLRGYQLHGGYTPGPLYAFCALAGLAGSVAALRRRAPPRQRCAARACLLFFSAGVAVLLVSDVFLFSWRYQLPALITLPPAAALAITALTGRQARKAAAGTPAATGTPAAALSPQHGPDLASGPAGGSAPGDGPALASGPAPAQRPAGQQAAGPAAEPGHGHGEHHGERYQHQAGQPGGSRGDEDGSRGRAHDDRREHPHAAGQPVQRAPGGPGGEDPGEGAGQVGG